MQHAPLSSHVPVIVDAETLLVSQRPQFLLTQCGIMVSTCVQSSQWTQALYLLTEMEQEELRLLQSLQEYQAKQQQTYRELEQTFAAQREELGEMRRQGSRSHQSSSVSVAGRSAAGLV